MMLTPKPVFWTAERMAGVLRPRLGRNLPTGQITRLLRRHIAAGRLPRISEHRGGWLVTPPPASEDQNPLPPIGAAPEAPAPATENAP
jgi:hypothetical protein